MSKSSRLISAAWIASGIILLGDSMVIGQEPVSEPLRQHAVSVLHHALTEQPQWVKVHAAEAMLALDYREDVRQTFLDELEHHGEQPQYRIGIWRVLARTDRHVKLAHDNWVQRIVAAFEDEHSPDRIHAAESLGKLEYEVNTENATTMARWHKFSEQGKHASQAFARWVLLNSGVEGAESFLADLLDSDQEMGAGVAAYAFRFRDSISRTTWDKLAQRATTSLEPDRVYLASAAMKHAPDDQTQAKQQLRAILIELAQTGNKVQRYQACEALAEAGRPEDVHILAALLNDDQVHPDVQVAAALAICRIGRRDNQGLGGLDWAIIAIYGLGMIGVGWFYARRTGNTEDYLLGGRNMRWWAVGLSLFASLLSTISYLAMPGEVIRYGPMILCEFAFYPIIFLVVGWGIIPIFMRLRITSAYEVLETRFGLSIRMFGSLVFLLLRLLWMATILYVSSDKILVPTLAIDDNWTPVICAILAAVTILYTSIGGLRAVVATDVVQTAILLGGAMLTLVLISVHFGGIGWWPDYWQVHWPDPEWSLDPTVRMSFVGIGISALLWYVCTAGSDQMAIQRYQATCDAPAARRLFLTSLCTGMIVLTVLSILGFALLAYFSDNPHMIADGQSLLGDADKLFPRYIVAVLPTGVSGLMVAAMLAAAMSSLSSGVNSASSVIVVDFIDRFRHTTMVDRTHVRLAKWVSVFIGVLVVGISLYVSLVPGNIIEIAYRVVNLFTVPLFILFFMALYIPWATPFGTWVGSLSSAAVAVGIGYWNILGLDALSGIATISFVWILPGAMVAGVVIGPLASMLPIGQAKPMISQ